MSLSKEDVLNAIAEMSVMEAVSYTHLTLPTMAIV